MPVGRTLAPRPHGGENAQVHTHTHSSLTHAPIYRDCTGKPGVEMTARGMSQPRALGEQVTDASAASSGERLAFVLMLQ